MKEKNTERKEKNTRCKLCGSVHPNLECTPAGKDGYIMGYK